MKIFALALFLAVYVLMIIGSLAVEGLLLLSVHHTLRRTDKMSALEALNDRGSRASDRSQWLPPVIITAAATEVILAQNDFLNFIKL